MTFAISIMILLCLTFRKFDLKSKVIAVLKAYESPRWARGSAMTNKNPRCFRNLRWPAKTARINHCERILIYYHAITGEGYGGCSTFARLSLQPKQPRVSLTSDDAPTELRRKSAGSPNPSHNSSIGSTAEPYIYSFDETERSADGTVILRYVIFEYFECMATLPSASDWIA